MIVVRHNEGKPQVLVNSCRHRGNAVCRAEEGHATSFMCTYHGWTYDLKGALVGVPGFKEVYHGELDRDSWGLIKAAEVDSFKGFIFATLDPEAPDLDEFLGDVGRMCINMIALKGDMQTAGGVQKFTIPCNWKFVADNIWDRYHVPITHASAFMSEPAPQKNWGNRTPTGKSLDQPQMVWLGEYGHALAGPLVPSKLAAKIGRHRKNPDSWRKRPEVREALGVAITSSGQPQIFPNFSTTGHHATLRLPKGPLATEVWQFAFLEKDNPPEKNAESLLKVNTVFGPGGTVEQDDAENWQQSTKGMRGTITQSFSINFSMSLGHDKLIDEDGEPARIETGTNEHAQLWY